MQRLVQVLSGITGGRHTIRAAGAGLLIAAASVAQSGPWFLVSDRPGTFTDISATGTVITSGDDASVSFTSAVTNDLVTTPTLFASTNGVITAASYTVFNNTALPVATQTLGLFPLWDDLFVAGTASLRHQFVVEGGVGVEVIQWNQVQRYPGGTLPRGTFEVKIFASGPVMAQFLYQDVAFASGGSSATIGVQWNSTEAAQYSLDTIDSVGAGTVLSIVRPVGLFPSFSATPTAGASPLEVQFTDQTYSSDPGGVTSWAWDFNGDSVVDSTLQHPICTFGCGSHSVSLTVTDASHPAATRTRSNYIVTDVVTPSFSWHSVSGTSVEFTDTTTPPATSWAWDFDNDTIIDSTAQNPTWTYPSSTMTVTARLTTSRLCGPTASTTRSVVAPALALTTLLTGGTGSSNTGAGNCFDITVTNPLGITISGVTMCPLALASVPIGRALTVDMYITDAPGGYASNHTNAEVWRKVATGSGLYNGGTAAAPVPINMTFNRSHYLPPGVYGVALHMNGCGVAYTTGNGANQSFGNSDFTLSLGIAKTAPFNFGQLTPRVWNGVLFYNLNGPTDITAPVANAGPDSIIQIGNVALDGRASSDDTSADADLWYLWTMTSKPINSYATITGSRRSPTGSSFTADVWGEYRVSLVVVDQQGNQSQPDEVVFTLPQDITPPTAIGGSDQSVHVGNTVWLDSSASFDDISPGNTLVHEWTILEQPENSYAYVYAYYPGTAYFYAYTPGDYRLQLVVIDQQGNRSLPDEVLVSTYNMAPIADAGPDQIGEVNGVVYLYGNSYDPDGDYLYANWVITSAPAGSSAYVYGYGYWYYSYGYFYPDMPGTYELELTVNDQWGAYSLPDTVTVVVMTPAQSAMNRLQNASTLIAGFDVSAFDAPGHRLSMRNQAAQIANFIQQGNTAQAIAHLQDLISRTDGWMLRGYAFDPKGLGQPFPADFIVGWSEQYYLFYLLQEALTFLNM